MAAPLTSGTLMPSTSEYTRLPTTTFLPCGDLVLGEPVVGVQRVVVHGDHAEQVVVVLGDRLAGPVPVDVADVEVLEVAAEGPFVDGHRRRWYERAPGHASAATVRPHRRAPSPADVSRAGYRR